MPNLSYWPKILFITPEAIFFNGKTEGENKICFSRQGKKSDYFARLIDDLHQLGFDIHIAQPDYRKLFSFLLQLYRSLKFPGIHRPL